MNNKCLIIAGAPEFYFDGSEEYSYIIACDAGICHARSAGIVPNLIVGDFDSYTGELEADIPIIRTPSEKDDTDTMLAVKLAIEKGFDDICIVGGTGGRLDHMIANLSTLGYIALHGCKASMYDRKNRLFTVKDSSVEIKKCENCYLSIFSITDHSEGVTLEGVKYKLKDAVFENCFPLGVSNEFEGDTAFIEVKKGILLVVISEKS